LHLSDTHFVGTGSLYGKVDVEAHLRALLGQFETGSARPEAIIITGDMADNGGRAAYRRLRRIVEPLASRLGAKLIWVMGNHDSRAAVRVCLLDEEPGTDPIDRIYWLGGLRVIALDTSVPGQHYGELTKDQLQWLATELAVKAPEGTILAMHHPPVPSVLDLAVLVELQDQRALAEVLHGTDVRAILAGHLHYSTNAMFAGINVSVAAASCYNQDLSVSDGGMRTHDGAQAINLVHVYHHTVMHSVAPMGSFPVLTTVSAKKASAQLKKAGVSLEPLAVSAFSHGAGTAK